MDYITIVVWIDVRDHALRLKSWDIVVIMLQLWAGAIRPKVPSDPAEWREAAGELWTFSKPVWASELVVRRFDEWCVTQRLARSAAIRLVLDDRRSIQTGRTGIAA